MFDFEGVSKALGSVSLPVEMGDGEKRETRRKANEVKFNGWRGRQTTLTPVALWEEGSSQANVRQSLVTLGCLEHKSTLEWFRKEETGEWFNSKGILLNTFLFLGIFKVCGKLT